MNENGQPKREEPTETDGGSEELVEINDPTEFSEGERVVLRYTSIISGTEQEREGVVEETRHSDSYSWSENWVRIEGDDGGYYKVYEGGRASSNEPSETSNTGYRHLATLGGNCRLFRRVSANGGVPVGEVEIGEMAAKPVCGYTGTKDGEPCEREVSWWGLRCHHHPKRSKETPWRDWSNAKEEERIGERLMTDGGSNHCSLSEQPREELDRRHEQARDGLEHALRSGNEELYRGFQKSEERIRIEKIRRMREREGIHSPRSA